MAKAAELTLEPGLDGVRTARRLASVTLTRLPAALSADAELVVTELVTNAMLHGTPPVTLRLRGTRKRLRIEVVDCGRTIPVVVRRPNDGMTGRGLAVVESLANAWGVEPAGSGKLVWAELGSPRRGTARRLARNDPEAIRAGWSAEDPTRRYEIRLGWVPTELLVTAKAHIDNIVRELALMQAAGETEPGLPAETVRRLIRATEDFADARNEIKRQAIDASRQGQPFTDLTLHLPVPAAHAGLRYLTALDEADQHAHAARLLTIAAAPSHRVFREWYVRALAEQLVAASRNEPIPPIRPFSLALATEFDRQHERRSEDEVYYRYAQDGEPSRRPGRA